MNLGKKKILAAKALKVGKDKIVFLKSALNEIKEAIRKEDIKHLKEEGAILVKEKSGRKKNVKRKKRGPGKIKKKVNKRKQEYVIMTRKLRAYTKEIKNRGLLSREDEIEIRKKIRNREFSSKANLRDYIGGLKK